MSYWATILSHAAWPSRSTISRRSRVASSQSCIDVRPCSCGARSNGRRSGLASASAAVIRSPPMSDEALRIAHHEGSQLEAEQVAVRERQVVGARDAHAAGLGVEAGREVRSV